MPVDWHPVVPNPRDKKWGPAPAKPSLLRFVLKFLCAPVLLAAGGCGYLWATEQTVKFTPGELPRLAPRAQAALPQAVPPPALMAAPAPASVRPQPVPAVQRPSAATQAVARRAGNGRFYFDTAVNGAAVPMVFDTGASVVVLRWEDAIKAGMDPGNLVFNVRADTANGVAEAASVFLGTLRVGSITRSNVRAVVVRQGKLRQSLLGQSFLGSLAGHQVEGDRLVLKGE